MMENGKRNQSMFETDRAAGSYLRRAMPLLNKRNFTQRAFTVGIGELDASNFGID
jgi:hypothetical protein